MSISEGGGRTCNQLVRHIAMSIMAQKHDLFTHYYDLFTLGNKMYMFSIELGIPLYIGKKTHGNMFLFHDDNYEHIYSLPQLDFNLKTEGYFQSKCVSNRIYKYIQDSQDSVKHKNEYCERYNNNNDCFMHIRLGDVEHKNAGFHYYDSILKSLSVDKIYIATDSPDNILIHELKNKYNIILLEDTLVVKNEDEKLQKIIQFGSTAKHVILSYGSFSAIIGYLSYNSFVYFHKGTPETCWDWGKNCSMFDTNYTTTKGNWIMIQPQEK